MTRLAAIDIGTNSTRLLVAEVAGGRVKVVETGLCTTRLGEGINEGILHAGAMERTLAAVAGFAEAAQKLGARQVVAAATSAVRDAANRADFLAMVKERAGLEVRVLSGEEEARLSHRGVLSGLAVETLRTAVLDVGGGSTEFIWSERGKLRYLSVNAGAVRMTEGRCGEEDIAAVLEPAVEEVRRCEVKNLVGVGGTITTLAAIDQRLELYDPGKVHGYVLTAERVKNILHALRSMDMEERRRLPGLQPERADIIVAGTAIVKLVMDGLFLDAVTASEADILHGLVLEEVETKHCFSC